MKLVSAELMRQIDRAAIDGYEIPGLELMENAGRGIAEQILIDLIDNPSETEIVVFCGKGNNGGDGYVIARLLRQFTCDVHVYFIGPPDQLSPDAKENFDRLRETDVEMTEILSADMLPEDLDVDFIIDAIFGTGFSGAPRDLSEQVIEYINEQDAEVISVDMPSGLNADNGQFEGAVVAADFTYTLALPKYGLFVSPGRELAGYTEVIEIGIPHEAIAEFDIADELLSAEEVSDMLPLRPADSHKGTFGKLFILAGSTGLTGAAAMAGESGLRGGCGLCVVGCPSTQQPILATKMTEVMTRPLPDVGKKGHLALRGLGEIRKFIAESDAVVIGPGVGQHHETKELIRRLLQSVDKPLIIDADGLNALEGYIDILKNVHAPLVITPHPGEFRRLTDEAVPVDIHARIECARKFAKEFELVLVLKGSPTLIASPEGIVYLNPTVNEGMATGGSGDVLSGLIGSFLAQGMDSLDAALCGVYIHGFAGDMAADELTSRAMIAGDIIDFLPSAFEWLE